MVVIKLGVFFTLQGLWQMDNWGRMTKESNGRLPMMVAGVTGGDSEVGKVKEK